MQTVDSSTTTRVLRSPQEVSPRILLLHLSCFRKHRKEAKMLGQSQNRLISQIGVMRRCSQEHLRVPWGFLSQWHGLEGSQTPPQGLQGLSLVSSLKCG